MTMPEPPFPGRPFQPPDPRFPEPRRSPARPERQPGQWPDQLYEQLLERRIVLAAGHLGDELATSVCAQLMTADTAGDEPVTLHLRTPDGDLPAAFAVADTIDSLGCPVHVLAAGEVGGPALAVLAATRRREATRHASFRLTEPRVHLEGTAEEVASLEAQHRALVDALYIRLAEITEREVDEIRDDARRGRFFTAEQAQAYGLVQQVSGFTPPTLG